MDGRVQINVVLDTPTPVYRQIVEQIRTFCVAGLLVPGESLPSVRVLARDLGVHFNTVAEAYRALADEGWLEVRQGKSVSVKSRESAAKPSPVVMEQQGSRLRHFVAELRGLGMTPQWIRLQMEEAMRASVALDDSLKGKA
jgi:DNA-binding transcriptional regulator YhcF (GntR family)